MRLEVGELPEGLDVTCVHEIMFLQVSQLRELLRALIARVRPVSSVRPQMRLEVGELPEDLVARERILHIILYPKREFYSL